MTASATSPACTPSPFTTCPIRPTRCCARLTYVSAGDLGGFRLAGDRAYVGANFFGLGIVDISDPDNVVVLGQHKSLGQTKIGDVAAGKVGLIDHMEGFVLIDVSDETAPEGIGSYFLDGYARDVVTAGTIAYATDSPSGLYVFDLSRPGLPEPIGVVHAPAAPRDIEVLVGEGDRPTLIVGAGGRNLQVYDVSDPAAPGSCRRLSRRVPPRVSRSMGRSPTWPIPRRACRWSICRIRLHRSRPGAMPRPAVARYLGERGPDPRRRW